MSKKESSSSEINAVQRKRNNSNREVAISKLNKTTVSELAFQHSGQIQYPW